jgi:hypothetical protein
VNARYYEPLGRQDLNERSREKAINYGQPWSTADSKYIQDEWVDTPPQERDEFAIARKLGRTIEACRNHAEVLRGSRPRAGGGQKNRPDTITRQTCKPYLGLADDDDPLKEWYS